MFFKYVYYLSSMLQGAQKKNVVLSGEAMKEMAKQAKANREERKLTVGVEFEKSVYLCIQNDHSAYS